MAEGLVIQDLHVSVDGKEILKGVSLSVRKGEVHALMGPNGSGKSTLSFALMGHPKYQITRGSVTLNGVDILALKPNERARLGLFLAFQYPVAVPGVTVANFLRTAVVSRKDGQGAKGAENPKASAKSIREFMNVLKQKMAELKLDIAFASRHLNDGFSGGEKKRVEILQMALLEPEIAVLDETDSGLDIDALRIVAEGINRLVGPNLGVLLITHYSRILGYIKPTQTHVLVDGQRVVSGGPELAQELEARGYDWVRERPQGSEDHAREALVK